MHTGVYVRVKNSEPKKLDDFFWFFSDLMMIRFQMF